jgi:hypothetical protein
MRTPWILRRMMVGSDDHLKALGALMLDFTAADEGLAAYAETFLRILGGAEFPGMGDRLQELNFSAKVKTLRVIIGVLASRYTIDGDRLMLGLNSLSQIADHRNDIVHGWITWDAKAGRPAFRNKKKPLRSAAPDEIRKLCKRLATWMDDFRDEVLLFLAELEKRIVSAESSP